MEVTQKVTKEAYELGEGCKKTVLAIYKALKDGWQPGQDMPIVFQTIMADLVPAVQGIEKLTEEQKEDQEAFFTSFMLPAKSLAFELLKGNV